MPLGSAGGTPLSSALTSPSTMGQGPEKGAYLQFRSVGTILVFVFTLVKLYKYCPSQFARLLTTLFGSEQIEAGNTRDALRIQEAADILPLFVQPPVRSVISSRSSVLRGFGPSYSHCLWSWGTNSKPLADQQKPSSGCDCGWHVHQWILRPKIAREKHSPRGLIPLECPPPLRPNSLSLCFCWMRFAFLSCASRSALLTFGAQSVPACQTANSALTLLAIACVMYWRTSCGDLRSCAL